MIRRIFHTTLLIILSNASIATPLIIQSDSAELLINTNTHNFFGNVKLTQNNDHINADNLILVKTTNTHTIKAFSNGTNNVIFKLKDTEGYAKQLHFDKKSNLLVISGDATMKYESSSFSSNEIIYDFTTGKISTGNSGDRVTMKITQ